MAKTFEDLNKLLADYYKSLNDDSYFDDPDGKGLFLYWAEDNGLDPDELEDELNGPDANDCIFVEFDDNFPFAAPVSDDNRLDEIRKILLHIYTTGQIPIITKTIKDFPLSVTKNDISSTHSDYKNQIGDMYPQLQNDGPLMEFLAIGRRNGDYDFLLNVADSFVRDRIYNSLKKNKNKKYDVTHWVKDNKFLQDLYKKNPTKANKFKAATQSYLHRIMPKLQFIDSAWQIEDSISDVAEYIVGFSQFIYNMITKQSVIPPFQIDCMIAVKDVKMQNSSNSVPLSDDDADDDDDDDDDDLDDDDKQDDDADLVVDLGNVQEKLKHEKIDFFHAPLDDAKVDEISLARSLQANWNKFKAKMNSNQSTNNIDPLTYPRKKRVCLFADRRGRNDDINNKDALTWFDPPNNCNSMPASKHTPEWYFQATRLCLIPRKGYDNGIHDESAVGKGLEEYIRKNMQTISSQTSIGGPLTFTFIIESVDQMKCYMHWCAQTMRFYPQDLIEILPLLFVEDYQNNKDFAASARAKELAKKMQIKDVIFETFYASFGMDPKFPKKYT